MASWTKGHVPVKSYMYRLCNSQRELLNYVDWIGKAYKTNALPFDVKVAPTTRAVYVFSITNQVLSSQGHTAIHHHLMSLA